MPTQLITTQRMLKKIRKEEDTYARRVANLRTLRARLERKEEVLLIELYPRKDVIYIKAKFHDIQKDRLENVLDKLPSLSLEELDDLITYSNTPKG